MVDANLQREHILPSEKAFAYKIKMEAMSHQGTTCGQLGHKSRDAVSDDESGRQIQRYIRLTYLIPEILQQVDEGRIAFNPAVELSYLTEGEQQVLLDSMERNDCTPSHVPTLVPNEQVNLIQRIYEAYLAPGASCGSIAKQLTATGIPGIRRNGWDNVAISRVLKNPVYVMADQEIYLFFAGKQIPVEQPVEAFTGVFGCHLVGKRDRSGTGRTAPRLSLANHSGVISSNTWLACQEKLNQNRQMDRTHALPERGADAVCGRFHLYPAEGN